MPGNLFVSILFPVISANCMLSCWTSIWGELWKNLKVSPFVFSPSISFSPYPLFLISLKDRLRALKSGLQSAASTLVLGHRHQEDLREQHQLLLKWALWRDVMFNPFPGHLPLRSLPINIIITIITPMTTIMSRNTSEFLTIFCFAIVTDHHCDHGHCGNLNI